MCTSFAQSCVRHTAAAPRDTCSRRIRDCPCDSVTVECDEYKGSGYLGPAEEPIPTGAALSNGTRAQTEIVYDTMVSVEYFSLSYLLGLVLLVRESSSGRC